MGLPEPPKLPVIVQGIGCEEVVALEANSRHDLAEESNPEPAADWEGGKQVHIRLMPLSVLNCILAVSTD